MGSHEHGYDEILTDVEARTGLKFVIWNSGGHQMIFEARTDGGQYVWVTDADADVIPLPDRREYEADGYDIGFMVNLLPAIASPDEFVQYYASFGTEERRKELLEEVEKSGEWINQANSHVCLASVTHHTARAEQLGDLIVLALKSAADNAHHTFDKPEHVLIGTVGNEWGHDADGEFVKGTWKDVPQPGRHTVIHGIDTY